MKNNSILGDFKSALERQDCAPLTVEAYIHDLQKFILWFERENGETFSLAAVTPVDIRRYRQHLLETERLMASTVNRRLAAIARLMGWAMTTGQIAANPSDGVRTVKQAPNPPRWLTKKEQYALERTIERDLQLSKLRYPKRWLTRRRDASLVQFLFNTGLRLRELTAVHLDDVTLTERRGQVLVRQGKGHKQRKVPLNAEARRALRAWLDVRPASNSPCVWVAVEEDDSDGLSERGVQHILTRYAQDAGLADLTPHVARHTFAKNLANSGVGLEMIASLLGHSRLDTTRIYIAPDEQDLELAVQKLEK